MPDGISGCEVDPETEITVTCGSTEAMLVSLLSLINPGDEVILTQPFYENYWPDCVLAGATPRFVPLRPPHWRFDPDELAAAFNEQDQGDRPLQSQQPDRHRLFRADLEEVAALCRKWDVIAITDEIYEHIIYDGRPARRARRPGGDARAFGDDQRDVQDVRRDGLAGRIRSSHRLTLRTLSARFTTSFRSERPLPCRRPAPWRIVFPGPITRSSPPTTRRGAIGLCKALWEIGFEFEPPEGAYYIMAGISAFGAIDDVEFARYLVRDIGVATVPGSSFFQDKALGRTLRPLLFLQTRFDPR